MCIRNKFFAFLILTISLPVMANDRIVLEVTTIKGNEELPKILYIVPWKEIEQSKSDEQKLVLHSLFGDLFDPTYPAK
ncbi:MAG: hypothetical protein HYZ31_07120 [Gammaproteobacteria bacterium]|jgi:hypothetical protein|nr:hypothetical protein [Gammaproteobacteria bacterium]